MLLLAPAAAPSAVASSSSPPAAKAHDCRPMPIFAMAWRGSCVEKNGSDCSEKAVWQICMRYEVPSVADLRMPSHMEPSEDHRRYGTVRRWYYAIDRHVVVHVSQHSTKHLRCHATLWLGAALSDVAGQMLLRLRCGRWFSVPGSMWA